MLEAISSQDILIWVKEKAPFILDLKINPWNELEIEAENLNDKADYINQVLSNFAHFDSS
jgi:hypothetical protein